MSRKTNDVIERSTPELRGALEKVIHVIHSYVSKPIDRTAMSPRVYEKAITTLILGDLRIKEIVEEFNGRESLLVSNIKSAVHDIVTGRAGWLKEEEDSANSRQEYIKSLSTGQYRPYAPDHICKCSVCGKVMENVSSGSVNS
jgi:hypothetical protein